VAVAILAANRFLAAHQDADGRLPYGIVDDGSGLLLELHQDTLDPDPGGEDTLDPDPGGEGTLDPDPGGEGTLDPDPGGEGTLDPDGGGEGTLDPDAGGEGTLDPDAGAGDAGPDPGESDPPSDVPSLEQARRLLEILTRYNEGDIGPGHCP
jgi:hypothetical protein